MPKKIIPPHPDTDSAVAVANPPQGTCPWCRAPLRENRALRDGFRRVFACTDCGNFSRSEHSPGFTRHLAAQAAR